MEEHDEGCERRIYSLEDLRDLQNKLMLMSGKGDQGQCEVDQFAEVTFYLLDIVVFHHGGCNYLQINLFPFSRSLPVYRGWLLYSLICLLLEIHCSDTGR